MLGVVEDLLSFPPERYEKFSICIGKKLGKSFNYMIFVDESTDDLISSQINKNLLNISKNVHFIDESSGVFSEYVKGTHLPEKCIILGWFDEISYILSELYKNYLSITLNVLTGDEISNLEFHPFFREMMKLPSVNNKRIRSLTEDIDIKITSDGSKVFTLKNVSIRSTTIKDLLNISRLRTGNVHLTHINFRGFDTTDQTKSLYSIGILENIAGIAQ